MQITDLKNKNLWNEQIFLIKLKLGKVILVGIFLFKSENKLREMNDS